MHRSATMQQHLYHSLVHQSVAIPSLHLVVRFRQLHRRLHHHTQRSSLRQRLSLQLVYHRQRPVGRNHQQRHLAIISFSHGRSQIEQCRATRHTYCHRALGSQRQAQGIESSRTLIGGSHTIHLWARSKIVCQGSISTSWAHNNGSHSVSHHQRSQNIYIYFV